MKIKEYAMLHEKPFYKQARDAYNKVKTHGDLIGLIRSGIEAEAEFAAIREALNPNNIESILQDIYDAEEMAKIGADGFALVNKMSVHISNLLLRG